MAENGNEHKESCEDGQIYFVFARTGTQPYIVGKEEQFRYIHKEIINLSFTNVANTQICPTVVQTSKM